MAPQSRRTATVWAWEELGVGTQEAHFKALRPKDSQTSSLSLWLPSFSLLPGTWRDCRRSSYGLFFFIFKMMASAANHHFLHPVSLVVAGSPVCTFTEKPQWKRRCVFAVITYLYQTFYSTHMCLWLRLNNDSQLKLILRFISANLVWMHCAAFKRKSISLLFHVGPEKPSIKCNWRVMKSLSFLFLNKWQKFMRSILRGDWTALSGCVFFVFFLTRW